MLPHTVSGAGPLTLIFLHYFGGSQLEWRWVVARLEGRFRCVTADAPGFGEAGDVGGFTVEEMAEQVAALVEASGGERCVVVGHSMMGKVGMVVASRAPSNLVGMVLVAPSPLEAEPMTEAARAEMVRARETEAGARRFFVKGAKAELIEEMVMQGTQDVLRADPVAWRRWPQSGAREDWSGAVKRLELPVLVVVGELDEAIPLEFQKTRTIGHLGDARLEVLEGIGHMVPYEAPERLAGLIDEFVGELG